ncbi:hypothetical protein C8F01DRAFT_1131558 [Mycena amicta]|nr:hypothetical protein C8F01DRAFT_1131558 [Mycena amicta]
MLRLLLSLSPALQSGDSGCNLFFCLNITIEVKPIFEPFGWVGLGWGRQMKGTHMVILWDDADGSRILSQRYGVGHVEPVLEPHPPRVATVIEPIETTWKTKSESNYSTSAFQIPFNKSDPYPGTMIWAYSLRQPDSDPSADLTGHYVAGTINMRLDKIVNDFPGTQTDVVDSHVHAFPRYEKAVWHGILVSVGFLLLLPGASLIARWGRTFTPRWFKVHRALNFYIALPVIAVGWALGPLAVFDRQATHFADAHQICGILLFGLYIAQLFLGRFIHSKHSVVGRAPHPPTNILHVVLGITVITLAFIQVRSGFDEWAKKTGQADVAHWCHDVWAMWALALPVLYFGGLALLKRQFAQEVQGRSYEDTPGKTNYIALATTPVFDSSEHDIGYSELESGVPLLSRRS